MKNRHTSALATVVVALALLVAAALPAGAAATNAGFETGDLSGWTISPPASGKNVASHPGNAGTYAPQAGSRFLQLIGLGCAPNTAKQTVTLKAGETFSGIAAFDARDYLPYNDSARVQVLDAAGALLATPYVSDVTKVGNYGDGPWTPWSYTATAAGSYTIVYSTGNGGDCAVASYGVFDSRESVLALTPVLPGGALQATLTSGGTPLAGKTVTFTSAQGGSCVRITDAAGVAICSDPVQVALAVASQGYSAEFLGDIDALASSGSAGVV